MSTADADHQPIEDRYVEQMNQIANALNVILNPVEGPPQTGFVLLVFPFGEQGRCNYISNGADRKQIAALFRLQAERFDPTKGNDDNETEGAQ